MRGKLHKGLRAAAGFTIMELLAVVAVLVVILAIAAPNLAPIMRGTEINRLDNYAKEIYVALADQFVGMESTGEYEQFNRTLLAAAERNLGNLDAPPADAPDSAWRNYYYLTSFGAGTADAGGDADRAFMQVMSRTSAVAGLAGEGRYIAEVNPRPDGTDVYAVFYSEDPEFSYEDVRALATRDRADRQQNTRGRAVGYFCGLAASGEEMPDRFSPRARFVNGEELFLHVSCTTGLGLVGSESGMTVKVTLTDGSKTEVLELAGGEDFHLDALGNVDMDILLDSMREGMHLADLFDFQPGADLMATVEVNYTGSDGTTVSTPAALRAQASANSLYAANSDGLVDVANLRHLANLSLLPQDAFAVRQTADISFDASTWGKGESTELSSATKAYNDAQYATEYVNPLDPGTDPSFPGFSPLDPVEGASWSYDGQGNKIAGLAIRGSGPVGMFATIRADQLVSRVVLVDTVVEGAGPAGTLAGVLQGRVQSCGAHVAISTEAQTYKQAACLVSSTGAGAAGGLVGEAAAGSEISESYAAVDVAAPEAISAGGLVGRFAGTALSTCYSSGVVDGAGDVGGLVGSLVSGSVQGCYSTSDVNSGVVAGGLVGYAGGGSVQDCVSYGRVSVPEGGAFSGSAAGSAFADCRCLVQTGYNEGLAAQPEQVESADLATLASARLAVDHSHPYRAPLMGEAFPFAPVLDEHWGNWPDPDSVRPTLLYYEHYADDSYGFYGTGYDATRDIAINTLDDALVVLDDGYALLSPHKLSGFDYALNGADPARASLAESPGAGSFVELPVKADPTQYATEVGSFEEQEFYYLYYWDDGALVPLADFHVYQLPVDLQMPGRAAGSYYDLLEVTLPEADGVSSSSYAFYYNPDLAKMAQSPGSDGLTPVPADPSELLVRTARQLNRVGYQPLYWGASLALDRDVDFGYYAKEYLGQQVDLMATAGAYANQPIGVVGQPFTGVFDGRNNVVIDYCQDASGQIAGGLFGSLSGTVRNLHLAASSKGGASVSRTGAAGAGYAPVAGALAGWIDGGTVEGCSVSGYRVSLAGSASVDAAAVGGLAGLNQGFIARCTAANVVVSCELPSNAGAVLGIGGLAGGSSSSVQSSYAVDNNLACKTTTSGSGRTVSFGGIVGAAFEGSPEVSNCYAYVYAGEPTCAPDDTVACFAVADPSLMPLYNCFFLDVGESYADAEAAVACDPSSLQNAQISGMTGGASPRVTYGETMSGHVVAHSAVYPYPVVCRDAAGELAHYGYDWYE